jgi:hypothetical protein
MEHSSDIDYDRSEPDAKIIGLVVGLSAIFLLVVFLLSYLFYGGLLTAELNRKENVGVSLDLRQQRLKDLDVLTSLKWIDEPKGQVKIPIDLAMKNVQANYSR